MNYLKTSLTSIALAMGLTACGSSIDTDDSSSDNQTQAAQFSLGVSDAAVESAAEVNIFVRQVILRNGNGEDTIIDTLDDNDQATKINLLDFQGSQAYELITDLQVEAGDYQWIRMDLVNGVENNLTLTSHIVFEDASIRPLVVTRKGNDGIGEIQLNNFALNEGNNEFVVEFDLKRSLVDPKNNSEIKLKPTGVRLANQTESGHIAGTISSEVIGACEVDHAVNAGQGGEFGHAVYLYADDVSADATVDINESDDHKSVSPLATATLSLNAESGNYEFEMGYVGEGNYELGYTCLSHLDDAETIDDDFSLYAYQNNIQVEAQVTANIALGIDQVIFVDVDSNNQTERPAQ
ncbi:DUF4382 domain-containing protein [Catenovulum sediminis]|uniref:DUF4382 domain-containing protein n=1 Tax=Catenovulum sediminis TaxID=1740262 RepID=A0ABV1RCJ7_9ALTE|nr:DUF4382 domain-containing protein [Catenovulum sediminis]